MVINWSEYTLGEIASFKYGKFLPKKDLIEAGFPVYSGYGVVGYLPTYEYEEEQLVIVCRGEGGTGDIKLSPPKCSITNLAIVISCNKSKVNKELLYWVLKLADTHSLRTGSAQAQIVINSLEYFRVRIPNDLDEQRAIASILSSFDNKIEINRQINQTLEQIAQTVFKSWFVYFEPVKAKIEAKAASRDPKRAAICAISGKSEAGLTQLPPEQYQQLSATASLFPDEMVESELGVIPKGWEVSSIGQEVTVVGGSTPSTGTPEFWDGEFAWVTPKDLSRGCEKILIASERKITSAGVEKVSSGQLPVGTVLLSSRAPIGYLALSMIPISINQGFIAMRCEKRLPNTYVLQWATTNLNAIKQRGSGTTFAEISKSNFRPMKVIVPDAAILSGFQQLVIPLYEQITNNIRASETLTTLRDTLLPKLLSGELTVGECEREMISGG